jgi:serine protease Do
LPAEVVGVDRETDLALLRVAADGLEPLAIGDSDALRQGQLVLAIGSPLGLESSVTLGVVSAVARQLRPEDPMIYVQTDAPINPGNSGGPLLDLDGRLVGVNTLIFSQSGGSEGIGFAVPANIARAVAQQLGAFGRVRRGDIGVHAQTLTPELGRGLGIDRTRGVIVGDVVAGGPAAEAGLRIGDVILALDGKPMENGRQLDVNVYRRAGDTVRLDVLRQGETLAASVIVAERSDDVARFADLVDRRRSLVEDLGILAITVGGDLARRLGSLRIGEGVLVAGLAPDRPASDGGLLPGDVIHAVNRKLVEDVEALRAELGRVDGGVVLQVERQRRLMFLAVERD